MYVVYRFWNQEGTLLYVGCTGRGISRVEQHRRGKDWFGQTASITLSHFSNEQDAFREEARAIRSENPVHNTDFKRKEVGEGISHDLDPEPPKRKITDQPLGHNRTSGARNVSFHKASQRWIVQISKNGKAYRGGYFYELEDAIARADQMRKSLYGPNLIETVNEEGDK